MQQRFRSPGSHCSRIGLTAISFCSRIGCVAVLMFLALGAGHAVADEAVGVTIVTPTVDADRGNVIVEISPTALVRLRISEPSQDEWPLILTVRVSRRDGMDTPPVLGFYAISEAAVVFTPRFPFVADMDYDVIVDCERLAAITDSDCENKDVTRVFRLESAKVSPSTVVRAVYPTADVLPENLLKFYVYFSATMAEGNAFNGAQILDAAGAVIPDAFVETTPELWDPAMTRLTLICHPGRVKRGLEMRERSGPALEAGKRYRLVIETTLKDAYGLPLVSSHEKEFRIEAADRRSPSPQEWTLETPQSDNDEPLVVGFGEPLDHALARRVIAVEREGEPIEGTIELGNEERRWQFRPRFHWAPGTYQLVVHSTLEDLAGNSIHRLFDVAAGSARTQPAVPVARVDFTVLPGSRPSEQ